LKILGVFFNKSGPAKENISGAISRMNFVLSMWKNITMNELKRKVVCKTIALSKLWFIANFMLLSENTVLFTFFLHSANFTKQIHHHLIAVLGGF
jgi:hypothetical protein